MNRELDAVIAEKILGWAPVDTGGNRVVLRPSPDTTARSSGPPSFDDLPKLTHPHRGWYVPLYSGQLDLALWLCKHVKIPMCVSEMPLNPEKLARKALEWWLFQNGEPQIEIPQAKPVYTAVVLDADSTDTLVAGLDDFRQSWMGSNSIKECRTHADHMTINLGRCEDRSLLGRAVEFNVRGLGVSESVVAVCVDPVDAISGVEIRTKNAVPHVTVFVAQGAKPEASNLITDWDNLRHTGWRLCGEIAEIESD